MNNRDFKNFCRGEIYHIYNRGNNKEKIFFKDSDYKAFLFRLSLVLGFSAEELKKEKLISVPNSRIRISAFEKSDFKIHSFCLMPNHFHLLIEQTGDVPISKLVSKVCTSYAMYVNKKYGRVGHLFQDQFKAVHVDNNEQLMWIFHYIHQNPVKDNLIKTPEEYVWSSYLDFKANRNLIFIDKKFNDLIS
ncbi:MAG: transposase [Candidatus Paceibacterota bacterium]